MVAFQSKVIPTILIASPDEARESLEADFRLNRRNARQVALKLPFESHKGI